jgi:hypothetical protein
MKHKDREFFRDLGWKQFHNNCDNDWHDVSTGRYVQISWNQGVSYWRAIHSTSGPAARYWIGPRLDCPIAAYVHAELENWGEP